MRRKCRWLVVLSLDQYWNVDIHRADKCRGHKTACQTGVGTGTATTLVCVRNRGRSMRRNYCTILHCASCIMFIDGRLIYSWVGNGMWTYGTMLSTKKENAYIIAAIRRIALPTWFGRKVTSEAG